jgi:hypothetical protein
MSSPEEYVEKLNCAREAERTYAAEDIETARPQDASDDLRDDGRRLDDPVADDLAPLVA